MEDAIFVTKHQAAFNTAEEQAPRAFKSLGDSLQRYLQPRTGNKPQQRYVRRGVFLTQLTEGINRRQPWYVDAKGRKRALKPLSIRAVGCLTGHLSERGLEHLRDLCKETEENARAMQFGYVGRTFSKEFFVRLQYDERFKKPEGWVSTSKKVKAERKEKPPKPTTASLF